MTLTIRLTSGQHVLAKEHPKHGLRAVTYANRSQARRAAAIVRAAGIPAEVFHPHRAFYVEIFATRATLAQLAQQEATPCTAVL